MKIRDLGKTETLYWTQQWEEDEELQEEYSLEEFLEKQESECPCPTWQGTNIGWGYE